MCEHKKLKSVAGSMLDAMHFVVMYICLECGAYRTNSITVVKEFGFTYCGSNYSEWQGVKDKENVK